jgi:hypothetical protein
MADEFEPYGGLPITPEQDKEIRDFIATRTALGESWDTLEFDYMLAEMLFPPPSDKRIDFCEQFAQELTSRSSHLDDICVLFANLDAPTMDSFTESEWKWTVREAQIAVERRKAKP